MTLPASQRPANLVYAVDETPPVAMCLFMGLQHTLAMSSTLVLIVFVAELGGGGATTASDLVRMSMIASGIGTILQALGRGPVGSGYLCPCLVGPAFIPASILAVKTGGLSLLFGMTILAGAFQAALSTVVHRLRAVLPPEVTGVIVTMVGISLVPPGVSSIGGLGRDDPVSGGSDLALGLGCLALMIGLTVWGRGAFRLYGVLIGAAMGYLAAASFGLISSASIELLRTADTLTPPRMHALSGISFDWLLVAPFLIAALSSVVKTIGDLSTSQRINDDRWVAPEMRSIRRGVLADSLAVFSAGLLGGIGQSTSSSNVGLSLATGVTSRVVGFYAGGFFIAFAFVPEIAMAFVVMPVPIKGAILVFVACFMIVAGLQLITSRLLDARKIFTVGAALVAGLGVDMAPALYQGLPAALQSVTSSSMAVATVVAIALNLVFRIGISRRAVLDLDPADNGADKAVRFLLDNGAAWGARADVINRAVGALTEFVDVAAPLHGSDRRIRVNARYDELHLDLYLLYGGNAVVLPESAPTSEQVAADPDGLRLLSGYIIRTAASSYRATRRGDVHLLHLRFEH